MTSEDDPKRLAQVTLVALLIIGCIAVLLPLIGAILFAFVLWIFAEIAIIATDIAEVVGTAIGLNLLFGIPLELGVIITAFDVFLILWLQRLGFRWIEAFVVAMLGVIAAGSDNARSPSSLRTKARCSG